MRLMSARTAIISIAGSKSSDVVGDNEKPASASRAGFGGRIATAHIKRVLDFAVFVNGLAELFSSPALSLHQVAQEALVSQ